MEGEILLGARRMEYARWYQSERMLHVTKKRGKLLW
jgi:hypothetical protein